MTRREARKIAMGFLATYEREEPDAYEAHVTRVARDWINIIQSREYAEQMVEDLLHELAAEVPDDYGVGWDELGKAFREWADHNEYLEEST